MLTEDYNGTCPNCGFDRMLVRYGSQGYYQFDACSKCGFAYGTNHYDGELFGKKVWEGLIHAHKKQLEEKKLPLTREGMHDYIMSMGDPGERMTSVFLYKTKKEIKGCL